jgi:hypothetical protein
LARVGFAGSFFECFAGSRLGLDGLGFGAFGLSGVSTIAGIWAAIAAEERALAVPISARPWTCFSCRSAECATGRGAMHGGDLQFVHRRLRDPQLC